VGSKVVQSEIGGEAEEEGFSDVAVNSGEDDNSGDELESDVRDGGQNRVRLEDKVNQTMRLPDTQKRKKTLTFEKSANVSNSKKESLPVVGIEQEVMGQNDKGVDLAVSDKGEGEDRYEKGGSQALEDRENVKEVGSGVGQVGGGPETNDYPLLGLLVSGQDGAQDSQQVDHPSLGQNRTGCEGEFEASRFSSLSEPEEVLSVHRARCPKPSSKIRKQKPNCLGVPKFVQLVEAMKEAGPKL
jgi:hypothetical protein